MTKKTEIHESPEELIVQLAAAQAVIARLASFRLERYLPGPLADDVVAALTNPPQSALVAAKADAWDEGYTHGFYDREVMHGEVRDASEGPSVNPYRTTS